METNMRIIIVMPAYNAAKTIDQTYYEIPDRFKNNVILCDDGSHDATVDKAHELGIKVLRHENNRGYGRNQKTCYQYALGENPDIVIMLHPDYQYTPKLIPAMVEMIASGHYDIVLASRVISEGALKGGMPMYKYWANRFLTGIQNLLMGQKLSEYHTGYRAFRRNVLEALPFDRYSDDFIFDNEILCDALIHRFRIGEISCPARYFPEASSIKFKKSLQYGIGVLYNAIKYGIKLRITRR